ncbi:hypothetical protein DL98DRAFT_538253 [Cadophora sp. DSE1049]|nr:hypothetical protein DL98DRAFT_538253 [Cadophora sp. DSE1049]
MEMKMKIDELSSPSMTPEGEMGGEGLGMRSAAEVGDGEIGLRDADVESREMSEGRGEGQGESHGQSHEQNSSTGDSEGKVMALGGNGTEGTGDGGAREADGQPEAVDDQDGVESEESELPVLRDSDDVNAEEESLDEKKVLRSEIPDSEADTEDADSPVKGTVDSKVEISETDEQDVGEGVDMLGGTQAKSEESQNVETETMAPALVVESLPSSSNDHTAQHSTNETLPTSLAHQDSSAVSFVDDEAMIILPHLTTSNLQPTHKPTQTQTQTQEGEVVNSHLADAVAVMSDIGGGTQDVISSVERAGGDGGGAAMNSSGEVGSEVLPAGEMEVVSEVVEMDEVGFKDVELLGSQPHEDIPSEKAADVLVKPDSSSEQPPVQNASAGDPPLTTRKEENASEAPQDEDVMMSDSSPPSQQIEVKEDPIPPTEKAPEDINMQSHGPDVTATTTTTARSIPDSDDEDEELPDADPISKSEEEVTTKSAASNVAQSAITKPVEPKERDSLITDHSSSPEPATTFKPQPPPKTPNTAFKAPTLSTPPKSQSTETTSSPSKPKVTTSTPRKETKEKEKTPTKSFTVSEGSQNMDVLMAELKTIKIASIQARNASLEAEIKKKKARLEEVSKELKYVIDPFSFLYFLNRSSSHHFLNFTTIQTLSTPYSQSQSISPHLIQRNPTHTNGSTQIPRRGNSKETHQAPARLQRYPGCRTGSCGYDC